jgi:CubicO group peptidase (beta-lactamase class C family)
LKADYAQLALPHTSSAGVTNQPLTHYSFAHYPGGTFRGNVHFMARMLLSYMNKGKYGQAQLMDPDYVRTSRDIAYPIASPTQATAWSYRYNLAPYTLLGMEDNGYGYTNRMVYDTATKIGIVILTNSDGCAAQVDSIMNKLIHNADN